ARARTRAYALSLHDALPISVSRWIEVHSGRGTTTSGLRAAVSQTPTADAGPVSGSSGATRRRVDRSTVTRRTESQAGTSSTGHSDRKSTRLNSSHVKISYAV